MRAILTILFLEISMLSLLPQKTIDVVYLKNGSIYKGEIIENSTDGLKIKTFSQNTIAIKSENIIKQETETYSDNRTIKTRGYFGFISGGILVGSTQNELRTPFSTLFENNYRINKYSAIGFATGLEMLNEATVPLAINLKGMYPLVGGTTLFVGGSLGHSYSVEDAKDEVFEITDSRGGFLANAEVGLLFPSYGHLSFFIAAGYRYNELSYTREDWWLTEVDRTIYFNRISLRVGVCFY